MPRIYVASLSDYNNAILHGTWIDLEIHADAESVNEQIAAMLNASPLSNCNTCGAHRDEHDAEMNALPEGSPRHSFNEYYGRPEEYAIHDYEGFGAWAVSEYESIATVVAVADAMTQHDADAVSAWIANHNSDVKYALDSFEDAYCGQYQSGAAYAEEKAEEAWNGETPFADIPFLSYVDWERVWHGDYECAGTFITSDGHVFDGNV